jgi:transposase-like protein
MPVKDPQTKQSDADKREARLKALHNRWRDKTRPNAAALELVREACADGATVMNICAVLGISDWTFRSWRDKYPEFNQAVESGRAIEHDRLVGKLNEVALAGNVTALIFALKSRHNYVDSGVGNATRVENKVSIQFVLPDALSPKQYLDNLTATATTIAPGDARAALEKPGVKAKVMKELALDAGKE